MLDTKSVTEMVEQQITIAVENQVSQILNDVQWMDEIESKIIKHIQDRITARFSNISDMPELISTVEVSISKLMDQGRIPGIGQYIDANKITRTVDGAVQILVQKSIDNLVVDAEWLEKIEKLVNQNMTAKVGELVSGIDVTSVIASEVEKSMTRWQEQILSATKTHGINDQATGTQITVLDDAVVIDSGLATKSFMVENDAEVNGTMVVKNLVVKGSVNTDNRSWNELVGRVSNDVVTKLNKDWQTSLVQQVLKLAKTDGIDFAHVSINGRPLVEDKELNPTITESNIQKLGKLRELIVVGPASINDTVHVKGKRVGVNTNDPEMALSVWDEEVNVLSGKFSKNTAFLGTGRKQSLALGVNRTPEITIDEEGLTTIRQLRIDKFKIGHATQVPGYSGQRGDFILNSDPKPDTPFAWICLGGFRWQALKSA